MWRALAVAALVALAGCGDDTLAPPDLAPAGCGIGPCSTPGQTCTVPPGEEYCTCLDNHTWQCTTVSNVRPDMAHPQTD